MNSTCRTRQWNSRDGTNTQSPFLLGKMTSETKVSSPKNQNAKNFTPEQISGIIFVASFLIYSITVANIYLIKKINKLLHAYKIYRGPQFEAYI